MQIEVWLAIVCGVVGGLALEILFPLFAALYLAAPQTFNDDLENDQ